MNVWDFFKNLFREADKSSPANPLLHEQIDRSLSHEEQFRDWKNSPECRHCTDWLKEQYARWQTLPSQTDEHIVFLHTPSSKGFAVFFHRDAIASRHAHYFFDYLKERALTLDYRPQISDSRTWTNPEAVYNMYRYYLKPRTSKTSDGKINQLFGNILIELLLKDDEPFNLKFRATSYNDRLYLPPDDFELLMEVIFNE
ncbi:MAG TPA: hypothetical protein ENJ20_00965 [Bacteroidetes bacterium]|nr:hypothetical protein [Bacteroidota bacterium]